jgi:hypothetical protein
MLMAVQFQGFEQGGVLGFPAQITGGQHLRSRLNMYYPVSLGYRGKVASSALSQAIIPGFRSFHPYSHKLSKSRSQGGVESRSMARIDDFGRGSFVRRLQCRFFQRMREFRTFVPCMLPPIANPLFRELCRAGYDLIKTNTSKLIHYKTRQDAEFIINTFKEDQKCH